jgi:cellulose synthase/poly-beta-1,6-N-acetylglucosamine synthase-like glycosyltransferase
LAAVSFWVSVALVAYHHIAYPYLLRLLARLNPGRDRTRTAPASWPSVTLIVPAHNERAYIAEKLENLAALDYEPGRLTILVVFDGCTDGTQAIARNTLEILHSPAQITLFDYPQNRGKVAVLNDRVAHATTDIVALSDVSALLPPDALRRAAAHFSEPDVGVVCPTYRLSRAGKEGERAYWNHQTRVKAAEARLAAAMGAHGAFYLFRRGLWSPLPPDTINDDFILPMRIVLRGYRAIYDPTIVVTELEVSREPQEFSRRVRIGAGNLQQAWRLRRLADPRRPGLAFVFLSGKGLRALIPFLGVATIFFSLVAAWHGSAFFRGVVAVELLTAALAMVATVAADHLLPSPLRHLKYLAISSLGTTIGAFLYLARHRTSVWRASTIAKGQSVP